MSRLFAALADAAGRQPGWAATAWMFFVASVSLAVSAWVLP